jgi:ribonuclease BN (tRNA processing enzyme)
MRIQVLGAYGSTGQGQRPSAFLVNDRVLVDAGTVSGALGVEEQLDIECALLSHAHLDHIAGLAFLTDTLAITGARRPLLVASLEPVLDVLRTHCFNNKLWPDFSRIPPEAPVVTYRALPTEVESRVSELWVTPVLVNHTVPTTGFIIHDGETGFVYSGDTGPTDRIWALARELKGLRAVVIETAFPNRLAATASVSKHLTPALLEQEMAKIPPELPLWIYHIKPPFLEETTEELMKVDSSRIHILEQGKTYTI